MSVNFRPINGFEGRYFVNEDGDIFSLLDNKGRVRRNPFKKKQMKDSRGYCFVSLSKKGKKKKLSVHRIVAEAFIPNPNRLPQINHKDENKANNHVDNLEWCTAEYNANYGSRNERMIKSLRNDIRRSLPVLRFSVEGCLIDSFPSMHEAARVLGFNQGSISNCCRGYCNTYKGFVWKLA